MIKLLKQMVDAAEIEDMSIQCSILKGRYAIPTKIKDVKKQLKFKGNGSN
jgi:hypothetical protein